MFWTPNRALLIDANICRTPCDLLLAFPPESANYEAYLDELFEVCRRIDPIRHNFAP
jgi:hypothetical protein